MYWEDHTNFVALTGVLVGGLLQLVPSIISIDPSCALYNICANWVWFSKPDQPPATRLISSWQIGPSKGLRPAITCYNLNPVYFWPLQSKFLHYTEIWPNSGKKSVHLHPRPTNGMRLISSWQIGPTNGLQLAITCFSLNPVCFLPLQSKL
jgi:hypothetical protein